MPRWIWFVPLCALVTALAALSFRMGWIVATISETDVIEAWAAHYVASEAGGSQHDCTARPGHRPPVWILVSCVHHDGRRFDYPVDKMGRLISAAAQPGLDTEPET